MTYLWSLLSHHEAGVQNSDERMTLSTHSLQDGFDDRLTDRLHFRFRQQALRMMLVIQRQWRDDGAHAARVRTVVAVKQAFVILDRRHQGVFLAVAKGEDGDFVTMETLFNDNFAAGLAQEFVHHQRAQRELGFKSVRST